MENDEKIWKMMGKYGKCGKLWKMMGNYTPQSYPHGGGGVPRLVKAAIKVSNPLDRHAKNFIRRRYLGLAGNCRTL